MLVRLQRKEEGWEAGTIAKKKKSSSNLVLRVCNSFSRRIQSFLPGESLREVMSPVGWARRGVDEVMT